MKSLVCRHFGDLHNEQCNEGVINSPTLHPSSMTKHYGVCEREYYEKDNIFCIKQSPRESLIYK